MLVQQPAINLLGTCNRDDNRDQKKRQKITAKQSSPLPCVEMYQAWALFRLFAVNGQIKTDNCDELFFIPLVTKI